MAVTELASVDGTIAPTAETVIPLKDDGLYRGDGVFEVIRLYGGRPFALRDHLDRLERSAAAIELDAQRAALEPEIDGAARGARRRRRAAAADRHPRRAANRADRAAGRAPRQRRAGDRHLRADADPHRGQVALLRRQHAGDPDRQGRRRRRGAARPSRRDRARGADLDDLLGRRGRAPHPGARHGDPRLDHPARGRRGLEVAEGEYALADAARGRARPSSPRPSARSSRSTAIDETTFETGPRSPSGPRGVRGRDRRRARRDDRDDRPHRRAEADLRDGAGLRRQRGDPEGARVRPRAEVRHRARPAARRDGLPRRARSPRSTAAAGSTSWATG